MDPLTALAVTANILQLVEAGYKGVHLCWEIYQTGSDIRNGSLLETTQHLQSTCSALSAIASSSSIGQASIDPLLDLSNRCQNTSQELIDELQQLVVPAKSKIFVVVGRALRSTRKARDIERLRHQLSTYEAILDTRILAHLSEQLNKLDKAQVEARSKLDAQTQILALRIESGEVKVTNHLTAENIRTRNEIEQLRILINTNSRNTDDKIDNLATSIQQTSLDNENKVRYSKLLESLHFEDIDLRQNSIEDAHRKTCEWIFRGEADEELKQNSFVNWLSDEEPGYFWIQGKAGCGKSTLMSFLAEEAENEDSRIHLHLPDDRMVLKFFFWETGSDIQRSVEGLLRSLLWQALSRCTSAPYNISQTSVLSIPSLQSLTWTKKSLMRSVSATFNCLRLRTLIIVDGLDEACDDDLATEALEFLKTICNAKVCASSRWSSTFEDFFQDNPSLRMQDFTRPDIELYINEKLLQHPKIQKLKSQHPEEAQFLVQDVRAGAQGVFLWVKLVIKDVLRGVRNLDTIQILRQRVARIPRDMFSLYDHMLSRSNDDADLYHRQAGSYLRFVLNERGSLLDFALTTDQAKVEAILSSKSFDEIMSTFDAIDFTTILAWVQTRCSGLIELAGTIPEVQWQKAASRVSSSRHVKECRFIYTYNTYRSRRLTFIHRTVADYLRNSANGRAIINQTQSDQQEDRLTSFKVEWCCWISFFIVGRIDEAPSIHDTGDDSLATHEVLVQVENVIRHLVTEGIGHPPYSGWSDPSGECLAWISKEHRYGLESNNQQEFDFPLWLMLKGQPTFFLWQLADKHQCMSCSYYSYALRLWAISVARLPQKEVIWQSDRYWEILRYLLAEGAEPESKWSTPCSYQHLSTIGHLVHASYSYEINMKVMLEVITSGDQPWQKLHITKVMNALCSAGCDMNAVNISPPSTFYPAGDESSVIIGVLWNTQGMVSLPQETDLGQVISSAISSSSAQYGSEVQMQFRYLNVSGKIYPISAEDSNELSNLHWYDFDITNLCLNTRFGLRTTETASRPIHSKLQDIITKTAPFPSREEAMKFYGFSEQQIQQADEEYRIGRAEVNSEIKRQLQIWNNTKTEVARLGMPWPSLKRQLCRSDLAAQWATQADPLFRGRWREWQEDIAKYEERQQQLEQQQETGVSH